MASPGGYASRPRLGLVVGHADDAALLELNLSHHLTLGIDRIAVVTVRPDAEAAEVVRHFDPTAVLHHVIDRDREDVFSYLHSAARRLREQFDPEWIGFLDTDEFIISAAPRLELWASDTYDLLVLRRFDAILGRDAAGRPMAPELGRLAALPIADCELIRYPESQRVPTYVEDAAVPQVFARAEVIDDVLAGGHGIISATSSVARSVEPAAVVVHLPFTTYERFERKVESIRRALALADDRLKSSRWIRWAGLGAKQLPDEFACESTGESSDGSGPPLTTPAAVVARGLPRERRADAWWVTSRTVQYRDDAPREGSAGSRLARTLVDPQSYVARYSDLAAAAGEDPGFDPASHFAAFGVVEGRVPSYAFNPAVSRNICRSAYGSIPEDRDLWWLYFDLPAGEREAPNSWFDADWFRRRYGLPGLSDWDAFTTYLDRVSAHAVSPSADFDEAAYRRSHPAVAERIAAGSLASGLQHQWIENPW